MTAEHWERLVALFEAALDRAPVERDAFLDGACGDDAALRAEVAAMLHADGHATGIFGTPPAALAASLEGASLPPGRRSTGPYRILHEIGRGGMGTVYLAERDDVGLRAAVKLVRGGLAAPERIQRFIRERRVLARLEHANIARLLDAGLTDDGTPWYAMEYVNGEPIDRWCDRLRLPLHARLALFEKVCAAVAYAHANLIVHRDLKPGNILVGEDGEPKLLDFGIAKLLEPDDDADALTRTDVALVTPQYAAPEQLAGDVVTTATDVYALGAVLFELLTGRRPYHVTRGSLSDLERALRTGAIPRPSEVAQAPALAAHTRSPAPSAGEVAAARSTDPARLRRQLAGEIDAIIMKALAPEPQRRYASADRLLDDLRSHRLGRPVSARPDSVIYRATRFIRRHRAGVAVAASFMVALMGFAGVVSQEQRATSRERDRAEAAAARASEIADFLGDVFRGADPNSADGRALVAVEMLDRSLVRVENELGDQPELQADLLHRLSRIYVELGRYEESVRAAAGSLALRRQFLAPTDREYTNTVTRLANSLDYTGRAAEAIEHLDDILPILRTDPSKRETLTEVLSTRARMQFRLANYQEARRDYTEAIAIAALDGSRDSANIRTQLNNFGVLLLATGDFAEAERIHRSNFMFRQRDRGALHTQTLTSLINHARALHALGQWREAETRARRAAELRRRVHPEGHPQAAQALWHLGRVLADLGEHAEAGDLIEEGIAMYRDATRSDHFMLAQPLADLARVRTVLGDFVAADSLLHDGVAISASSLGVEHPIHAELLMAMAELELARGAASVAELHLEHASRIQRAALAPDHPAHAHTLHLLGLARSKRDPVGARVLLEQALALREKRLGTSHPYTLQTQAALQSLDA